MSGEGTYSGRSPASTPEQVDNAVKPQGVGADYSFTLQAVMELQKSTGELTAAVNTLTKELEKQDGKLEKLSDKVNGLSHKIYAAGVVLAILVTISGFILNKSWDLMARALENNVQSAPQVQQPTHQGHQK